MDVYASPNVDEKSENIILSQHKTSKKVLLSCMIGNALEWYDFVIYGYFAITFGLLFFPNANHINQILASWGVFWTGFLARPLGAVIFGHIGDKISRKKALALSMYVMAIPTMLIGCLPTYEQIGILAPLLLILFRMMQGFAMGGEFTGSMIFLVEHAPFGKRGFWGSWVSFSAVGGIIIGSTLISSLNHILVPNDMQNWAWRIPFILSIVGSVVGGYIRNNLSDPTIYLQEKEKQKERSVPLKELFLHYKSKMITLIFLDFLNAVGFFMIAIFFATYFKKYLNLPEHVALTINTFNMCVFAIFILIGGLLSDRMGRKPILRYAFIGFIVFSYPLFQLMQTGEIYSVLLVQAAFAIMMGILFGTLPATLVEIFPTSVRFSGLSISHNICMALLGGGTPFLATHLIHWTNNLSSPSYLLIGSGIISLIALFFVKECFQSKLD